MKKFANTTFDTFLVPVLVVIGTLVFMAHGSLHKTKKNFTNQWKLAQLFSLLLAA
jgi:hypothetical protein